MIQAMTNIMGSSAVDRTTRVANVNHQFAGVMRVMNTTANGMSGVQGLECGSCWLSLDLTNAFRKKNDGLKQFVVAVTNHHVVGGSHTVHCNYYFNQSGVTAHVIVTDHQNDVALLLMDINELQLHAGERFDVEDILMPASDVEFTPASVMECKCVGFPFGRDGITLTSGVLSAYTVNNQKLSIVADAYANPGNSGGPNVSAGGVMGITTAVSRKGLNNETCVTPVQYALALNFALNMVPVQTQIQEGLKHQFDDHVRESGCLGFKQCGTPLNTQEWLEKHAGVGDHVLYERLAAHTCGHEIDVTPCVHCVAGTPLHACPPSVAIRAFPVQWNKIHNWCSSGVFWLENIKYMQEGNVSPFPAATKPGVIVTKVYDHEKGTNGLQTGDYIMGISMGKDAEVSWIDSSGMMANGRPYHTKLHYNPFTKCTLHVARKGEDNIRFVEYEYKTVSLDKLPNVHSAALAPPNASFGIGGVMMCPLTTELATRFGHMEYLDEKSDSLVFVVVSVLPDHPEWTVLHLTPGSLCTEVNHKKFNEQPDLIDSTPVGAIKTVAQNARKDKYINLTFETRNMNTCQMKEVCQMYLLKSEEASPAANMRKFLSQFQHV